MVALGMLDVEIETLELPTDTVVLACDEGCAKLLAVTVTVNGAFTTGAVNKPFEEIVPELTVQVTAGLLTLLTRALSCSLPPELTLGVGGVIVIFMQDSQLPTSSE
jgi:hypothetical protein